MKVAIVAVAIAGYVPAASITYDLSIVGANGSGDTVYRYVFNFLDAPLALNQELDIRFSAAQYQSLSNGVAPAGFDLQLFQPNFPPGADGDYSLFALVSNPSMAGIFSVDFTLFSGVTPTALQFFVNEYDDDGNFLNTVSSGLTEAPEPSTWWLGISGLLSVKLIRAARRLRR